MGISDPVIIKILELVSILAGILLLAWIIKLLAAKNNARIVVSLKKFFKLDVETGTDKAATNR